MDGLDMSTVANLGKQRIKFRKDKGSDELTPGAIADGQRSFSRSQKSDFNNGNFGTFMARSRYLGTTRS